MPHGPLTVGLPTSTFLPSVGGVEVGLSVIAEGLVKRGHRPVVMAPYSLVRGFRKQGFAAAYPVVPFPPKAFSLLQQAPAIGYAVLDRVYARWARRFGIDVWHGTVGYPVGVSLAHYGADGGSAPMLVRCAGEDIQRAPEIGYGMRLDRGIDREVRRWLPRLDRLVAISDSVADEYRAIGVPEARIAHVPNGVALDRFAGPLDRAAVRGRLGIDPGTFLFLCVGRNHPKKNLALLPEVADALRRRAARPFRILVVGSGCEPIREAAIRRDLADHLDVLPPFRNADGARIEMPVQALVDLYRSADAFVFPSKIETFGIVLVEAMAAGLPVITTDAPGCRDVVRRDRDGLTVDADDADGFAAAMHRVMDDAECRRALSAAALDRAKAFAWDTVVERYVALYREMLDDRARSSGNRKAAAQ